VDEQRTDLKAALRELAAEEAADIGPHAGLKRLIAYRRGTLPAAEREALQDHLSLCTRCAGLLLELKDFEAASAGGGAAGPESLQDEAWKSLARRLPWHVSAVRPIAGAARREAPRLRAPRFLVGAAAALLLALVGLTVWAAVTAQRERQRLTRLEQRLEEREEALAASQRSLAEAERQLAAARARPGREATSRVHELETRVAELTSALAALRNTQAPERRDQTAVASRQIDVSLAPRFALRGQEATETGFLRGGGAVNPVRIPAQAKSFTVAVSLAGDPVYDEYRVELVDRGGQVLWTGRRPGKTLLGDAGTSVSVHGLGPGRYRLRIEGLEPDRTELLAEYALAVEQ
jgi:anti-sigma factor ChrR (cupin superfamily)